MKELVIMKIEEYIDEYLFPPGKDWPRYWFDDRCYAIWAAEELVAYIRESDKNPYEAIEEFIYKMNEFCSIADGKQSSWIFEIGRETAKDILRMYSEGENV